MRYKVIKQTIQFTDGIFRGKIAERYITVYKRIRIVPVFGSPYRIISEEILK